MMDNESGREESHVREGSRQVGSVFQAYSSGAFETVIDKAGSRSKACQHRASNSNCGQHGLEGYSFHT